jgi:hypothetical protein
MSKYWYLWVLIIVLIPITAYVCYKAAVATKRAREERERFIEEIDRAKSLKDEFSSMSAQELKDADDSRVLAGVTILIDLFLNKQTNPNEAFSALPVEKQYAYVLNCILEDSEGLVAGFYRKNTPPVSPLAVKALEAAELDELASLFGEIYPMFDENDDETSVDYEKISEADVRFRELFDEQKFKTAASLYIKSNATVFTGQ